MTVNYQNITIARESRGITQSDLAKLVQGLSQGNLSRMEKGLLPIPTEIINLISQALDYPNTFFYKENQRISSGSLHYRKRITMGQKNLSILEAQLDIISMVIDELLDSVDINEFDIPYLSVTEKRDSAEIAYKIREYFNVPTGPIIEIVKLLEKHGVIVLFMDIDNDKFDGVTRFTRKGQPVMYINRNIPNDRKRFTVGHELGHIVMHLRAPLEGEIDDNEKEMQANKFSSEFNLPKIECRKTLSNLKYNDLGMVKMYWRMSKSAIIYRAKDLGLLSDSQYKYYMMQLSRTGQRKNEIETVDIDKPVIFNKMIELHLNDLNYSKEELSEQLGLSIKDFNKIYNNEFGESKKLRIVF